MNWIFLNKPIDQQVYSPDKPKLFGLDDLAGAALIGSGVSALGNLLNVGSQKSANAANLQAVRETNQANLELYNKQFADQYKLWQENNVYNDPSAQMARLRAAGLNPQLNMGSNPTGTAQAASAPAANPMQAAHIEAPMVNFSDVGNLMSAVSGSMKNIADAEGANISNSFIAQEKLRNLEMMDAQIDAALQSVRTGSAQESLLKAQKVYNRLQSRLLMETFDEQKQSFQLHNQLLGSQNAVMAAQKENIMADTAFKRIQTALAGVDFKYKPAQIEAALAQTMQTCNMLASQSELNYKLSDESVMRAWKTSLEAQGVSNSNKLFEKTKGYVVESYRLANQETRSRTFNGYMSGFSNAMQGVKNGADAFNSYMKGYKSILPWI